MELWNTRKQFRYWSSWMNFDNFMRKHDLKNKMRRVDAALEKAWTSRVSTRGFCISQNINMSSFSSKILNQCKLMEINPKHYEETILKALSKFGKAADKKRNLKAKQKETSATEDEAEEY